MGSEDAEIQCQTQSVSASVPCESAASYGIAAGPFVASVSLASNRTGTGTPVSATTVMLAQSAASHTPPQNVSVQSSVAASPLPHVQVIQQPLQSQYLQHLYAPQQQHMFLPGNLTIQPALQSIGGAPAGISLQLQGKSIDNKTGTPTIISTGPMQTVGSFGTQSLIPGSQMTAKACVPGQMLATSSKSTVIQGQTGFIPATTSNQTVVIGQLGVLSNPQSVLPHQAKAITDGQKGKSYLISQPATLHPKSPILPSPSVSCGGQMIATSQLKQLQSAPHIITTQAPTMINQAQLLGSLQALGVPPGITWAPGSLHSSAIFGQNPIFIRSQQSDMFIQSPPPQATIHAMPVAQASQLQQSQQVQQQQQQAQQQQAQQQQQIQQQAQQQIQQHTQQHQQLQQQTQQQQVQQQVQQQQVQQQVQQQQVQVQQQQLQQQQIQQQQVQQQQIQQQQIQQQQIQQLMIPSIPAQPPSIPAPQLIKAKPVSIKPLRPGSSVATQTSVSTATASSTSTAASKSQHKQRSRFLQGRAATVSTSSSHSQTATTQTQTHPPPSQKADAANQTKPNAEPKLASIYNKILEPFNKSAATETAFSPVIPEPIESDEPQLEEAPVEPIPIVDIAIVAPSPAVPRVEEVGQIPMEVEEEDSVPSPSPVLPTPVPVEKVIPSRKEVEAPDNVGIVMPMTDVKEKQQPQKAIVKPHVLTHIIEGFVIQEGSEPFPVTLPSYSVNAKEEIVEKSMEPFHGTQTAEVAVVKKKDKMAKIRGGPVELAKCEYCGKLGPKAKFKRSKRFCSTSCAKRFNAGYSKRLSIILPEQDQKLGEEIRKHKKKGSSKKGGKSKKKKLGLKSKKSWKKSESKLYEEKDWNIQMVHQTQDESMENKVETSDKPMEDVQCMEVNNDSNAIAGDEESGPPSPNSEAVENDSREPASHSEYATKSPLKWTVTDVCDFVQDLPGCSDYAEEFRSQEIDGQALLLLKEDHLMSLMSMKLGPALKVCARINSMRDEVSH